MSLAGEIINHQISNYFSSTQTLQYITSQKIIIMKDKNEKTIQKAILVDTNQPMKSKGDKDKNNQKNKQYTEKRTWKQGYSFQDIDLATSRYTVVGGKEECWSEFCLERSVKPKRTKRCFVNLIWKVKKLQEEKTNIVEEVDAMLEDFSQILQLFKDRIINYVKDKVESIVGEKNNIISKQRERLIKYEQQEEILLRSKELLKENQSLKTSLKGIEQKYQQIVLENKKLKDLYSESTKRLSQISQQRPYCPGRSPYKTKDNLAQDRRLTTFKLTTKRTLETEYYPRTPKKRKQMNENIKSLDKIKEKINQLKSQIVDMK